MSRVVGYLPYYVVVGRVGHPQHELVLLKTEREDSQRHGELRCDHGNGVGLNVREPVFGPVGHGETSGEESCQLLVRHDPLRYQEVPDGAAVDRLVQRGPVELVT